MCERTISSTSVPQLPDLSMQVPAMYFSIPVNHGIHPDTPACGVVSVQVFDLRPDLAVIDSVCNHVPHVADNGSAYEQVLLLRSGDDEGEGTEHAVPIASNAFPDVRICQPDSGIPRCSGQLRTAIADFARVVLQVMNIIKIFQL